MKRPDPEACYLAGLHAAQFSRHLEAALKAPEMGMAAQSLARASREVLAIPAGVKG